MSSAVGPGAFPPALLQHSLSCSWTWPTKYSKPSQASHGEQFWKLDLQISRNRSRSASLPKSRQRLQMVFTDCRFPICLVWPSPLKGANSLLEVDDWEGFSEHLLCSNQPCWFLPLWEPLTYILLSSCTSASIGKRTASDGAPSVFQPPHFTYLSENAFSDETLAIALSCLVTQCCTWSQRWRLIFPLRKYLFAKSGNSGPSPEHLKATFSPLNMSCNARLL